LGANIKRIY